MSIKIKFEAFGETKRSLRQWSLDSRCRVSYSTLCKRIRLGWGLEEALSTFLPGDEKALKERIQRQTKGETVEISIYRSEEPLLHISVDSLQSHNCLCGGNGCILCRRPYFGPWVENLELSNEQFSELKFRRHQMKLLARKHYQNGFVPSYGQPIWARLRHYRPSSMTLTQCLLLILYLNQDFCQSWLDIEEPDS